MSLFTKPNSNGLIGYARALTQDQSHDLQLDALKKAGCEKDLLRHFNIKTTERSLHVRKEQLVVITSPLDDLWKKGGVVWK